MKGKKGVRKINIFLVAAILLSSLHIPARAQETNITDMGEMTVSANEMPDRNEEDTFIENVGEIIEEEINSETEIEKETKAEDKAAGVERNEETAESDNKKLLLDESITADSEIDIKEGTLPVVYSESSTAVVTTNEQFYAAIADENVNVIQVNRELSALGDLETGAIPLILNRPLTIQGGGLSMRYLGIVLGADVTFKDITLDFTSPLLDMIAANGYQLTLDNVKLNATGNSDWTISVFCGGITGYELDVAVPQSGGNGTVIVKGNSTIGDIYAGTLAHMDTMSSVFDGNAKILIEEGSDGSIGKIYGCGGRESIDEGTGNLIYSGDAYSVTGNIETILYDKLVKEVEGFHNNVTVSYRGGEYPQNKSFQNISNLKIENGKLQLEEDCSFENIIPDFSVTEGELWLDAVGDIAINDFEGGGKLVLGEEQRLMVNGKVSASTMVYLGGIEQDGTSLTVAADGHTYIEAVQAEKDAFIFQDEYWNPGYVPKFVSNGAGGGSWTAPEEYITKVTDIRMEDFFYDTSKEETGEESIDIPIIVTYSEDTTLKSLDFWELDITINNQKMTAEYDEPYYSYMTEQLYGYTSSAADGCILRLSDETGDAIPREGTYEISITVPAEYTESGTQELTAYAKLTVGEKAGEEELEKIAVEKPMAVTGLKWNGEEQTGVAEHTGYTLNGDAKATEAGDYTVTAILNEGYIWADGSSEDVKLQWSILPKGISGAKVQLTKDRFEYTGNKVELTEQDITVTLEEKTLQYGTDYEICMPEDMIEVGKKTIVIQGIGNYTETVEATFEIYEKEEEPKDPEEPEVPEGLWIKGIDANGYIYTGKAIKPQISVYDGRELLKEKVDYTISYKNNVNANKEIDEENPGSNDPAIIITGIGNYAGKITKGFKIIPKDISKDINNVSGNDITVEDIWKSYNSRIQKPAPTVYDNGKKLRSNVHYTVDYPSIGNDKTAYKDAGVYDIVIRGKGNYKGERIISLTITEEKLLGQAVVSKIPNQPYTGEVIHIVPENIVVKYKGVKVAPENYLVECSDKEVGTATLIVKAKEGSGYAGEKRVTFKITGTAINRGVITGVPKSVVYTGEEITAESAGFLDALVLTVNGKKVEKQDDFGNENYSVTYLKNGKKGTAAIIFTGQNGYIGTVKKNFTIKAYNINELEKPAEERKISVIMEETAFYEKGGSRPKPVVRFDGMELEEGKDYTLSYQNNTAVTAGKLTAKNPKVIIKGRGNFTGNIEVKFDIASADLENSNIKMEIPDRVYQKRKNMYKSTPKLVDENGKVLRAGTDYEKNYTYSYKEDTLLSDGVTVRKAGEAIVEADIPPAGTTLVVTVKGMGNYMGTLSGEYRIVNQDISKAKVSVPAQSYTGKEIKPGMDEITVKIGKKELGAEDYKIIGYTNNVKKGTAKMTIKGIGEYGGYKTVNFSIRSKSLFWQLGF